MATPPPLSAARVYASSDDPEAASSLRKPSPDPASSPPSAPGRRRPPTERLTAHQAFYLAGLHGVGALAISGGINFAVAFALYTSPGGRAQPVRLFRLPNTLAGDAAVTAVAQCLVTWFIEAALVGLDLRGGGVAPVGWLREPEGRIARWFFGLPLHGNGNGADRGPLRRWVGWTAAQVPRALALAAVSFLILFGPTVGILTAVGRRTGDDWEFDRVWAPQVYKLLYGGILALLVTPVMAFVWLARAGWEARRELSSGGR